MTSDGTLPRRFGSYVLTAQLSQDVLGIVYRALRSSGERGFARLRILETDELSEDAVLDAIEEYGEIHGFLKNPAIAREVVMDSVGGVPFIAWNEESGRTLDALLARTRSMGKRVPIEHALLIAEKVATALDHAYNTTVDGERTLHGLVWPGVVSITDDGETRLTGFGLAPGVLPSLNRPLLAAGVGPYLAPEERGSGHVGRNADVYSVGAILFELLTGRLPSPSDPLGDLRTAAKDPTAPIAHDLAAILRMCLSPTETRYQSSGELRRELGKLLFSGPYAPSTFNLAFYLSGLFGVEIEAENRGRAEEASIDAGSIPELAALPHPDPSGTASPGRAAGAPGKTRKRDARPGRGGPWPLVIWLLAAAAVAGGVWIVVQRSAPALPPVVPTPRPSAPPQATPTAEPPPASTSTMSEGQFKEEVARRLAQEMKRLEQVYKAKAARPAAVENSATPSPAPPASSSASREPARPEPTPAAAPIKSSGAPEEPTEPPARGSATALPDDAVETPPKILSVVKPVYPPFALRARIGGVVILRILVGETGTPLDVEILKDVAGGLGEAAVTAVRRWKFEPARRNGAPVRAWTTVPIPFEP